MLKWIDVHPRRALAWITFLDIVVGITACHEVPEGRLSISMLMIVLPSAALSAIRRRQQR
ncbi:hypothetical protein KDL01_10040 [Actinospica durhamensis]|uniref:Uncharacterized protein n=1 Tax=Actinospica durhamensis TaxID=1508375 RepID=A0A941ISU2_9ACTN|nr:hypothetical protein [Actinospica durhamensis]MBR7833606.1 hypothetical protein [Actinospica durhamensis]